MTLLQQRTTIEIVTDDEISGYVFADDVHDGVQRLEWVFFGNFRRLDNAAMILRAVTDPAWRHRSFDAFAAHVEVLHATGADLMYCHAEATGSYQERAREYALEPHRPAGAHSIEVGNPLFIIVGGNVGVTGMCYARKREHAPYAIVEYWNLSHDYIPAPDDTVCIRELSEPVRLAVHETVKVVNAYDGIPPLRGASRGGSRHRND